MAQEMPTIFGKTRFVIAQMEEFLDKILEGAIAFKLGVINYIKQEAVDESCEQKLSQLIVIKNRSNDLRKLIGVELYTEMLIPDSRGDVLSLLQNLYSLIDICEDSFQELLIEKPQIPVAFQSNFIELTQMVFNSIEAAVLAARFYFRDPGRARDYTSQVSFYETEADTIRLRLKKQVFSSDLSLERKLHLRDSIDLIDEIADQAEEVGDRLAIYAIKRAY
ncbi:MAG: DUF47 domain-containing protein [Microcystaceae cyanobacterium]